MKKNIIKINDPIFQDKTEIIAQQKGYIKVLEERLANINAICDKEGIPSRMKVEGDLTAGIQTQARVQMLVDVFRDKINKLHLNNES